MDGKIENSFRFGSEIIPVFFGSVFLCVIFCIHSVNFNQNAYLYFGGDSRLYREMALDPSHLITYPFGLRILTPLLASTLSWILRIPIHFAFSLLTIFCCAVASTFFYFSLRILGSDKFIAASLGLALLGSYWFTLINLKLYFLTDPLNNAFLCCLIYCLISGSKRMFFILLLIATFNKNYILFFGCTYCIREIFLESKKIKTSLLENFIYLSAIFFVYALYVKIFTVIHGYSIGAYLKYVGNITVEENSRLQLNTYKSLFYVWEVLGSYWILFFWALFHLKNTTMSKFLTYCVVIELLLLTFGRLHGEAPRVFCFITPLALLPIGLFFHEHDSLSTRIVLLASVSCFLITNLIFPHQFDLSTYWVFSGIPLILFFINQLMLCKKTELIH